MAQKLRLGGERDVIHDTGCVAKVGKLPFCAFCGGELLQPATRCVSWVGKRIFTCFLLFHVQLSEHGKAHVSLSAHLDSARGVADIQRDGFDGSCVKADVFPSYAITACSRGIEYAIVEDQGTGNPINLGFCAVLDLGIGRKAQVGFYLQVEFDDLGGVEYIAKGNHRLQVLQLLKLVQRRCTNAQGRGVRSLQPGMFFLQGEQLVEESVVFGVCDGGIVLLVVPPVVVFDCSPEFGCSCCEFFHDNLEVS